MVPGAHRDALQIEQGGQVVRMRAFDQKRQHGGLVRGSADQAQARNALQALGGVGQELLFAFGDGRHADAIQIADGRAQPDKAGDIGRAGFEFMRRIVEGGFFKTHFPDHFAAAEKRRHTLPVLTLGPQRAGTGRSAQLVTGEGVEVAAQRRNIDRHVRYRLGAVNDRGDSGLARPRTDLGDRVDRAEHIGHMGQRQDFHRRFQLRLQRRQIDLAGRGDFHRRDAGTAAFGDQLPGHEIGMVLHARDQNHIAGLQARQREGIRHQIQGLGGARSQHQIIGLRLDEGCDGLACTFIGFGGLVAELVHGARHVGIVPAVEIINSLDHCLGFLRGIGRVQIHQRLAMHFAAQDRKIMAH